MKQKLMLREFLKDLAYNEVFTIWYIRPDGRLCFVAANEAKINLSYAQVEDFLDLEVLEMETQADKYSGTMLGQWSVRLETPSWLSAYKEGEKA